LLQRWIFDGGQEETEMKRLERKKTGTKRAVTSAVVTFFFSSFSWTLSAMPFGFWKHNYLIFQQENEPRRKV
jgi:hypothetical protein